MEALYQEILNFADIINNNTLTEVDFVKKLYDIYNTYENELNTDLVLTKVFLEIANSYQQVVRNIEVPPRKWFYMIQLNLLVKKLKKNISNRDVPRWRLQEMDPAGFSCSKPIAL